MVGTRPPPQSSRRGADLDQDRSVYQAKYFKHVNHQIIISRVLRVCRPRVHPPHPTPRSTTDSHCRCRYFSGPTRAPPPRPPIGLAPCDVTEGPGASQVGGVDRGGSAAAQDVPCDAAPSAGAAGAASSQRRRVRRLLH